MSRKTMNQKITEQLIDQLEAGTSPFQQPGFQMPINPTTGKNYRGMTALQLGMQDRNDPRWMTLFQASQAKWKIEKGAKGTLMSFLKTHEKVQLLDESGDPKLNSKNKPVTEQIKLAKPLLVNAFVFNADQVEEIPSLEEYLEEKSARNKLSPSERINKLVELSGAKVEYGYPEPDYLKETDEILMPTKEAYEEMGIPDEFEPAHLYGLARWTSEESRMNRPAEDFTRENMRASIASLFLASEMGVPVFVDPQTRFKDWIDILQADPSELERATTDAQYAVDYLMKFEQKRELKQGQQNRFEKFLQVGDLIPYNNTQLEVIGKLKKNALQLLDKETGNRFKISPSDGIYNSLLLAKNQHVQQQDHSQELVPEKAAELERDRSMYEEHEMEEEQEMEEKNENQLDLVLNQEEGKGRSGGRKR